MYLINNSHNKTGVLEGDFIPFDDAEYSTINKMRVTLFRASLFIMLSVSVIYIPINLYIGNNLLACIEIFFAIFALVLIKLVKNPVYINKCRYFFVIIAFAWAIIASAFANKGLSVFMWNALFIPYVFLLLGRSKAVKFCCVFIPIVTSLFLYSHHEQIASLSVETITNTSIFLFCLLAFCYFYETARSGIEKELVVDIQKRKEAEQKNLELISELKDALADVNTLSGLLPICASCKNIRDDEGYWSQVEVYLSKNTEAEFSHGLCPSCMTELYPDLDIDINELYKNNALVDK